ncbi:MAG: N-acetylmuramoyl-L-alanine amidase XlyA precursor [Pelotomaculum sp. PtaB.Bin104]|nr:MAG: N-acetylmuramoyl-L-alanine amidase XlyA precursor [Pelotomaculum sp. PtaB.Bin104]
MATTYTVQSGDTLYSIARRFGSTVEILARVNNITDPAVIYVGQVLTIPEGEAAAAGETAAENQVSGSQVSGNQATRRVGGLLYTLSTNKSVYRQGEDVIITLVKTNVSGRNIDLTYRTTQRYDFVVRRRANQAEVWRWSRGRSFAQAISTITLRPGRRQTFRVAWDQSNNRGEPVPLGNYTIEGFNVARELRNEGISINIRISRSVEPTPTPTAGPGGRNLLVNPGFENWPRRDSPPFGWEGSNLFRSTTSRTGNYAAELGESHDERAVLSQRVRIEPGRIYELIWWARENIQPGGVDRFVLFVEIFYYNTAGNFVGRTEPRYTQQDIPNNAYQRYRLSTGRVPAGARVADVRFTFEPSGQNNNTVKIDDVILRELL